MFAPKLLVPLLFIVGAPLSKNALREDDTSVGACFDFFFLALEASSDLEDDLDGLAGMGEVRIISFLELPSIDLILRLRLEEVESFEITLPFSCWRASRSDKLMLAVSESLRVESRSEATS